MTIDKPKCIKSEWVYIKPQGGYALKKGAPEEIKKEFKEFQKAVRGPSTGSSNRDAASAKPLFLDTRIQLNHNG